MKEKKLNDWQIVKLQATKKIYNSWPLYGKQEVKSI